MKYIDGILMILQIAGFLLLGFAAGDFYKELLVQGGLELCISVLIISMWLFIKIELKNKE